MVVELKVCLYNFYINIAINPIRWDTSIYDHNWVGTAPSSWQSSDSHLCHAIGLLQSWQKIKGNDNDEYRSTDNHKNNSSNITLIITTI